MSIIEPSSAWDAMDRPQRRHWSTRRAVDHGVSQRGRGAGVRAPHCEAHSLAVIGLSSSKRLVIVLGCAALVSIGPAPTARADSARGADGRCRAEDLAARLRPGRPGAGQRYATLFLRNRSSSRCTLRGYADALLLDAADRPVPTRIVRVQSRKRRTVVLRVGERARSRWHWSAVPGRGEPTDRPCQPTAAAVLITPPGATRPLRRPWRMGPVCRHGRIEATPVRHHRFE
jgi:uncharacterized protein DUF4232